MKKNNKLFQKLKLVLPLLALVLTILPAAKAAHDNTVWWDGVYHSQDGTMMSTLFPGTGDSLTVTLQVNRDDLTAARIRYWNGTTGYADMVWSHNDENYSFWKGTIPASDKQVYYRFELTDGSDTDWYNAAGMADEEPNKGDFSYFPVGAVSAFDTPGWTRDAVFYQIFPERFNNGDTDNDPDGSEPWGSSPKLDNFMGGDLQGVIDKLDYLNDGDPETDSDLGITAIYFNPIFESRTNHKYSTEDYENVDDNLGDNALLATLIEEAHKRGIKIVLDGVFNHTGVAHKLFDDVVVNGTSSPYYDYFDIYNWPISWYDDLNENDKRDDNEPKFYHWSQTTNDEFLRTEDYDSWWGYAHLPNLVTTKTEVRDYFIHNENAIAARWIQMGVDGWRLDVANEVEDEFWQLFRTRVKQENPEAYIVGEMWGDASQWLDGTMWDSTMNYRFRDASLHFFAGKNDDSETVQSSVEEFDAAITSIRSDYSEAAFSTALNLLDSHDTYRYMDRCGGDWTKLRISAIFQMTFIGAPMIYYGNENGMTQFPGVKKDPGNRAAMEWDTYTHPDRDNINSIYKKLIRIRESHPALRSPHIRTLYKNNADSVYAYARYSTEETAIVALNNSASSKSAVINLYGLAADGTILKDRLNGGSYTVSGGTVTISSIGAKNGVILTADSTGPDGWKQLYFRGTPNNFKDDVQFSKAGDKVWKVTRTFGSAASERFKIDVKGDWTDNYGDNSPVDNKLDSFGDDIYITSGAGEYTITVYEENKTYTIEKGDQLEVPANFTIKNSFSAMTQLGWDSVPQAAGYDIEQDGIQQNDFYFDGNGGFHGDLEPGTTYEYRIRAKNASSVSPWSNILYVTTDEASIDPPANVTAVPDESLIKISWDANITYLDNGDYEIFRSTVKNSGYRQIANVSCSGSSSYSYTDSAVSGGITYYYQIRIAVDAESQNLGVQEKGIFSPAVDAIIPADDLVIHFTEWEYCSGNYIMHSWNGLTGPFDMEFEKGENGRYWWKVTIKDAPADFMLTFTNTNGSWEGGSQYDRHYRGQAKEIWILHHDSTIYTSLP